MKRSLTSFYRCLSGALNPLILHGPIKRPHTAKTLILEKECRYFVDAFLNGYLNIGRVLRYF